jgi:hypothetical protein
MSTPNPRRIDRRTAEYLLGSASAGTRVGHAPLAALLAAAAVPGRPDELTSEQTIVAAFRTAHLSPAPQPGRLSVIKTAVLKVLAVKVLAVAATTTAGGVALAASTGALPNPLARPAPATSAGLSAAHPTATPSRAEHDRGGSADESKDATESQGSNASKVPSPSLVGLCHAYNVGNKTEHGKALDNPAFTVLITTAGGKDKVDPFCHALLTAPTPASGTARPSTNPDENQHGAGHNGTNHDTENPTDRTPKPGASPKR